MQRRSRTVRSIPLVAASAMMILVALSACAVTPSPSTATATATSGASSTPATTSSSPSPSTPASVTPTPPAADPSDPDAPANQCADGIIGTAVEYFDAGAGSEYYRVVFTNTGSAACELRGYPGVSVVGDGNGTQLGNAAERSGDGTVQTFTLAPGGTIGATLQMVNIGTTGGPLDTSCDVTAGDGWRIYPPHSFAAVFVSSPDLPACLATDVSWLRISPLAAE